MQELNWYELKNDEGTISPALLVYPERVEKNIVHMIHTAGQTERLRPHIKTHKMREVIELQMMMGIDKFKCATLAEAELLAITGAEDVLLAIQPVAAQLNKYLEMILKYPRTAFSTLVDNPKSLDQMTSGAREHSISLSLWVDINNGMNRTGITPGEEAKRLVLDICKNPSLILKGLHVYDGHIRTSDPVERARDCENDFKPVEEFINDLKTEGLHPPKLIAGGTPTFPVHAQRKGVELSPGTPLLWDAGYASHFRDLKFLNAAVLLTRIISKPARNMLCFDLGHKSVASEMGFPRVVFLGDHQFEQISHSEEHLVVKCKNGDDYTVGQTFYAIPVHICPTVSKYAEALTVQNHEISGSWTVAARDHLLINNFI